MNDSQILTDRTGSRRFLCFETLRIDYTSGIDHTAIYAQALALYKQGFRYWFADQDITEINENNEPFQQSSPEAELLFTYFRKPVRFEGVYFALHQRNHVPNSGTNTLFRDHNERKSTGKSVKRCRF